MCKFINDYSGGIGLSKTITGKALKDMVQAGNVIENGNVANCGSIKYDFVLSDEILKADFGSPRRMSDLTSVERKDAIIQPGEVVYVLTKEKINIPCNMYMTLSANRGMSEYGILTLGGFAVDPGYSGRLMFGLYNYSSTPFTIIPETKLVGAVFFELSEEETVELGDIVSYSKPIDKFPPRLVNIISQYSPIGLSSLDDSLSAIKEQVRQLKDALTKNNDEVHELKKIVQDTQEQTNKLSKSVIDVSQQVKALAGITKNLSASLEQEIGLRKNLSDTLDKKLEKNNSEVNKKMQFIRGAVWLATALGGIIVTLFVTWLAGWLKIGG